jgi:hypothetical protein
MFEVIRYTTADRADQCGALTRLAIRILTLLWRQ